MSRRDFFVLFSLFGEGFLSPQKQNDELMKEPQLRVFYMSVLQFRNAMNIRNSRIRHEAKVFPGLA